MVFNSREEIIKALETEFAEKGASFNNNEKTKSRERFWTANRLLKHYWDLKYGRKQTYRTTYNPLTGFHQLKTKQC